MSYIPIEDMVDRMGSKYKLVIIASRRVAELNAGSPKLIEASPGKTGSIALEEIRQGKVMLKQEEKQ